MDAKGSDTCYMLERPIVDKIVRDWCVTAVYANQSYDALLKIGELAYAQAIQWLCEIAYVSPSVMSKALDIRAAAMLSPFVRYGLCYETLLDTTTLDCADFTVTLSPDYRLAPPRRHVDYLGRLAESALEVQIAKLAQLRFFWQTACSEIENIAAELKKLRADKKRSAAYRPRRLQLREKVIACNEELDVLHKLERTRLYFHRKYLKEDLSAMKSCLDATDVKQTQECWRAHEEKVKNYRFPI